MWKVITKPEQGYAIVDDETGKEIMTGTFSKDTKRLFRELCEAKNAAQIKVAKERS